jgi:zinc protease
LKTTHHTRQPAWRTLRHVAARGLLAVAALAGGVLQAAELKLSDPIPVGPQVQVGKLANGLTYYIQKNSRPEKRLELRLAVKAGSVLEDDDQRGLAHVLEHMAFNGSAHFKKHELISYLQSIGLKFGADLNAYTSFDETVYILPVPTDKADNLEKAFTVLQDWAGGLALKDEDINAERNIVMEEWRLGKGAQDRMNQKYFPKLFEGSKYAQRLPIGTEESLKTFTPEQVKRFYHDWYRPDLMAVVVVGDIEPAAAKKLIEEHFSGLKNPAAERARQYATIPARSRSESLVLTYPEATFNLLQILSPVEEHKADTTIGDYRQSFLEGLFATMMGTRSAELTQRANPPFIGGGSNMNGMLRGYRAFGSFAAVGQAGVAPAVNAMLEENAKARQFGFTEAELARAKKDRLRALEQAYEERDKTDSGVYAAEYLRNFLVDEPIPGLATELDYMRQLQPGITLAEVNAYAKATIPESSAVLAVYMGSSKANSLTPDQDQLLASIQQARQRQVTAHVEKQLPTTLMPQPPKAGSITAEKQVPALGLTELTLSNGLKVWLKPTDFKNDQVLMAGVRPGGQSLVGQEDMINARYATNAVSAMGLRDFTPIEVHKILAGKTASAGLGWGSYNDSANGSSGHDDVEIMLQRLYLSFGPARRDADLYQSFVSRSRESVKNMLERPEAIFSDARQTTLYANHPRLALLPRPEDFDQLQLERVLSLHNQRFGSAKGFTFVFVGSFDAEKIKPLIATYIASLPVGDLPLAYKDLGIRPITGVVKKDVYAGQEAKSQVTLTFTGPATWSREEAMRLGALLEVLNIKFIDELREKQTLIYAGGIGGGINRIPYQNYAISASFPCAPDNVDKVVSAAFGEIQKIKDKGAEPADLDKVKQNWLITHRRQLRENGFWLNNVFINALLYGTDPAELLSYEQRVAAVTPEDLKAAANRYLRNDNYLQMALYPKKKDVAAAGGN